jgi:hypothetical protein
LDIVSILSQAVYSTTTKQVNGSFFLNGNPNPTKFKQTMRFSVEQKVKKSVTRHETHVRQIIEIEKKDLERVMKTHINISGQQKRCTKGQLLIILIIEQYLARVKSSSGGKIKI